MKIENCHPKIEDRIDLRPCPLYFSQGKSTNLAIVIVWGGGQMMKMIKKNVRSKYDEKWLDMIEINI